jgi:tetratricopeptide (TPR) repeat protein
VKDDAPSPCHVLAAALALAADPVAILPATLPCSPLDLMVALHQIVVGAMLADCARAQRAADAAWAVAGRFPGDPLLQAQAHWSQASAVLYVPDYARSLAHYDAALMWYDRACLALAPAAPTRDIRVVEIVRVFCLSELGRYAEARYAVEQAECWLQDHPNDFARLTLLLNRGQLAGRMGDYSRMVELADATIALAAQLQSTARYAQGWINRGHACINLGRFAEAESALAEGIAAATQAEEPITVSRALLNRAHLLRDQGRLFEALNVLREAGAGLAQAPGEAATLALQEAGIYEQLRQLSDAQRAARRAAELFDQQKMPAYSANAFLRAARIAAQQSSATAARDLLGHAANQAEQAHVPQIDAQLTLARAELAALPDLAVTSAAAARRKRSALAAAHPAATLLEASGMIQEAAAGRLTIAALDIQLGDTRAALAIYQDLEKHPDAAIRLAAHAGLGALLPPAQSVAHLQHAAALAVEQRRALPMEELQARYSSETSPHHMRLAAHYLASDSISMALESVCAAKAGPLLDLRAAGAALDELRLVALQSQKADLARWRQEADDQRRATHYAAQNGQDEAVRYHAQRAQDAEARVRDTERALVEAARTLGGRHGQSDIPGVAVLQAALPAGTALLEYAQLDDDLVCFLVRPGSAPECRKVCKYRALAPLLDRWSLVCRRLMDDQRYADAHRQIQVVLEPLWKLLLTPKVPGRLTI